MIKTILMFVLFPFLHDTPYSVEYVSCKPNEIIVRHEDENLQISLFNTGIIKEEGWDTTCAILKDAKKIRIEIDPSSKVEVPLPVYLFVDKELLQEKLMKESYAYPLIRNPEYTYEKQLEKAFDATQTMARPANSSSSSKGYALIAPIFLGTVLLLWFLMLFYSLLSRRKKRMKIAEK